MSRTRVGHVSENIEGAVYIGRKNSRRGLAESQWHNPYVIDRHGDREEVLYKFQQYLSGMMIVAPVTTRENLKKLVGKTLVCWCRRTDERMTADNRCHGDILIERMRIEGLLEEEEREW